MPVSEGLQRSGLDDLVQRLRSAGIAVGVSELIDAGRLLRAVAETRPDIRETARLKTLLGPVFCKSPRQQAQFDRIFEEWARLHSADALVAPETVETPTVPSAFKSEAPRPRFPLALWLVFGALLVAAFGGALLYLDPFSTPAPTPSEPSPVHQPTSLPSAQPTPFEEKPAPERSTRIYGYYPVTQWNEELRPGWLWLLLGAPLLLLLFSVPQRLLSGGRALRSGRPVRLRGWSHEIAARRLVLPLAEHVEGRLRRHKRGPASEVRRLERRPQLHVRRTLEATIRNLGVPTPRFRDARLVPSYLVLVEAASDQELAVYWAQRFLTQGLPVDIRRLVVGDDGEPRLLRLNARQEEAALPLTGLPPPPYGQRLVVVSDGAWMADDQGVRTPHSLRAGFQRWPSRVLFTTREPRRWGSLEAAIEQPEHTGDPGFLVLPVDENAVDAWSKLLVTGQLPSIQLESPQQYPRMIHDAGDTDMLKDEAPSGLSQLIAQLKLYLGPNGYFWLCCCAVPPIIHPQLVLLLGESFLKRSGAEESDLGYYVARNYRLLDRLPWIRKRYMPLWLRVSLLASISRDIQQEIRVAVDAKLAEQVPDVAGSLAIELEQPPEAGSRTSPRTGGSGDTLYLGFMSGLGPQELAFRLPKEWSRWIGALEPRRRWWRLLSVRARAFWDRLRFRHGLVYLGPRSWAFPTMLVGLAAALAILVGLSSAGPHRYPAIVRDSLFAMRPHPLLLQHWGLVRSCVFSPDGTKILTASADGTAAVWDAADGGRVGPTLRHDDGVNYAVFSPDGRLIATASNDHTARVWDATTGEAVGAVLQHEAAVNHVAFSPDDGARIVTSSADGIAIIWNAATGAPVGQPLPHAAAVNRAAFDSAGSRVVTASADHTARVWDATTGAPIGEPISHDDAVNDARFSPSGRSVVTASDDKTARATILTTGKRMDFEHADAVTTALANADGTRIVTASRDGSARVWNVEDAEALALLRHDGAVTLATISPDDERVLTASTDGTARVWQMADGAPVGQPLRHDGAVAYAAFSPDGVRVATASGQTARAWSIVGTSRLSEPLQYEDAVVQVAFSPDDRSVATASSDGTAHIWEVRSGALLGQPLLHGGAVNDVAFSADGARVVTASEDKTARIWNAATGEPVGDPFLDEGPVTAAAFSTDGRHVVTTGAAGTRVWDVASRDVLATYEASGRLSPDGRRVVTTDSDGGLRILDTVTGLFAGKLPREEKVYHVAFSRDGRRVLTAGTDGSAQVWDATTGTPLMPPLRHERSVTYAAFSPDGTQVVTASTDRTARIWNAAGEPVSPPLRHDDTVNSAEFDPDGRRIVTTSDDGTVRLWDATSGELLEVPLRVDGVTHHGVFSHDHDRLIVVARTWQQATDRAGRPLETRVGTQPLDAAYVMHIAPSTSQVNVSRTPLWAGLVSAAALLALALAGALHTVRRLRKRLTGFATSAAAVG